LGYINGYFTNKDLKFFDIKIRPINQQKSIGKNSAGEVEPRGEVMEKYLIKTLKARRILLSRDLSDCAKTFRIDALS